MNRYITTYRSILIAIAIANIVKSAIYIELGRRCTVRLKPVDFDYRQATSLSRSKVVSFEKAIAFSSGY